MLLLDGPFSFKLKTMVDNDHMIICIKEHNNLKNTII